MTTATAINLTLLNSVLDLIEERPDKWTQGSWVAGNRLTDEQVKDYEEGKYNLCGTTACVAGWAMLLSGQYKPILSNVGTQYVMISGMATADTRENVEELAEQAGQDINSYYVREAAKLLGLDREAAAHIFLYMSYNASCPKTFTDKVRTYLGLPTKHGALFDWDDDGHLCVVTSAEGENWHAGNDIDD